MKEIKSKLEMLDLYFPAYSFTYKKENRKSEKMSLSAHHHIDYAENVNDKNQVKIQIETTITDEENALELNVKTLAFFKLDDSDLKKETIDQILKKNTVAIMFPFIRSQVSLLTTQPGIMPIMLSPIDVNALVDNIIEEDKE